MGKFWHKYKIYKNGFTLAEVLITLVIVGVVAALTIPTVINTYVESSTVSKVKKAYSTLVQAKKLAEAQNGNIMVWNFDGGRTVQSGLQIWGYLKPHISLAKDCDSSADCYQIENTKYLKGDVYKTGSGYSYTHWFVLADGSVMWLTPQDGKCEAASPSVSSAVYTDVCAAFGYDINGNKPPNTNGKDKFYFVMRPYGVYPLEHYDCRKDMDGWGCAAYIIKYGNMNYLH